MYIYFINKNRFVLQFDCATSTPWISTIAIAITPFVKRPTNILPIAFWHYRHSSGPVSTAPSARRQKFRKLVWNGIFKQRASQGNEFRRDFTKAAAQRRPPRSGRLLILRARNSRYVNPESLPRHRQTIKVTAEATAKESGSRETILEREQRGPRGSSAKQAAEGVVQPRVHYRRVYTFGTPTALAFSGCRLVQGVAATLLDTDDRSAPRKSVRTFRYVDHPLSGFKCRWSEEYSQTWYLCGGLWGLMGLWNVSEYSSVGIPSERSPLFRGLP